MKNRILVSIFALALSLFASPIQAKPVSLETKHQLVSSSVADDYAFVSVANEANVICSELNVHVFSYEQSSLSADEAKNALFCNLLEKDKHIETARIQSDVSIPVSTLFTSFNSPGNRSNLDKTKLPKLSPNVYYRIANYLQQGHYHNGKMRA